VALGDRVASEFTRFLPTGYVTSPILLMGFSLLLFTARLHSDRLPRFGRNTT